MKKEDNFENLINKDKYQVFFMYSKAGFPFSFSLHPWVVINGKGNVQRFEIRHYLNKDKKLGYLHINEQPFFEGFPPLFPFKIFFSKTNLLKEIEGNENSVAFRIIDLIEQSVEKYPYVHKYSIFPGPNCGTYVEWVLKNFPEIDIKLPWNSFGKDFK